MQGQTQNGRKITSSTPDTLTRDEYQDRIAFDSSMPGGMFARQKLAGQRAHELLEHFTSTS